MDIKKIWKSLTRNTYLSDLFLMLFFCVVLALFQHKTDALRLIGISIFTAAVLEFLVNGLARPYIINKPGGCDFPMAVYMGLCTALMLPAAAPSWFPLIGLLVAYAITGIAVPLISNSVLKQPRMQIMPAAAAITFLTVFFRKMMFSFVAEGSPSVTGVSGESLTTFDSVGKLLSDGLIADKSPYSFWDFFAGNITGPLGTSCFIIILAVLAYLIIRRPSFTFAPLSFIAGALIWAFIFPRSETGRFQSIGLELCAGSLLFAAVFLLSVPKYLPKKPVHRIIYGFACGILTMLFRRFGIHEETVCVAIFLMNITVPFFNQGFKLPGAKKSSSKKDKLLGDEPDFMKKRKSTDDILDDL